MNSKKITGGVRELIADSIECMVKAHCFDTLVFIPNLKDGAEKFFSPERQLSGYLKRYAALVSSADKGAKLC